jgi:ferric hydroxamate transport system permease protein
VIEPGRRTALLLAALAVLSALLTGWEAILLLASDRPAEVSALYLRDGLAPRALAALLAGAALGLAGALMQRVLRNPIAAPSTLGITAGAQLALVAATLHAPWAMETSRETVALAGAFGAAAIVFALTFRRGLDPVEVALCGMLVTMTAGSLGAALILANGEYMMSLFIWGGGSLVQDGWSSVLALAWRFAVGLALGLLLLRPLAVLRLGDQSARGLGVAVTGLRLALLALGVWLAAGVAAFVGVIGFVGLAAPALAQLLGCRTDRALILGAPVVGALVLWLTDSAVQVAVPGMEDLLPTGAATALLGGPALLWLLSRLSPKRPPSLMSAMTPGRATPEPSFAVPAAALALAVGAAFLVGKGPEGWVLALRPELADIVAWRAPRIVLAAAAGAMLAAAGTLMQRITGNPLASPEILGVASGAGLGLAAVLILLPGAGRVAELAGAAAGSLGTLVAVLLIASRGRYGPERLLLAGVAVGAFFGAVVAAVVASGQPEAFRLLGWMSGSTNAVLPRDAALTALAAVLLIAPLPLFSRWLALLPLGVDVSRALGLPARRAALAAATAAALLTAASALFVGPLSFVGLIGPHLARRAGYRKPLSHLFAAALLGASLMVAADWLARTVTFPYEQPLGLFASLIAGPCFIWFLLRGARRVA